MRFTKGKHAFIVATHTDKAHIHNHIVFNSTAIDGSRKFKNFWFSGLALQKLSDLICLENGLSIITPKHPVFRIPPPPSERWTVSALRLEDPFEAPIPVLRGPHCEFSALRLPLFPGCGMLRRHRSPFVQTILPLKSRYTALRLLQAPPACFDRSYNTLPFNGVTRLLFFSLNFPPAGRL